MEIIGYIVGLAFIAYIAYKVFGGNKKCDECACECKLCLCRFFSKLKMKKKKGDE